MLLLGYFEVLDSERAIAWRAADSLSLRQFLNMSLDEAPPDHSTVSRTRRRINVETHLAWIIQCAVRRRHSSAGANPARQLSLQPVAVGADDGGNDIG